MTYKDAIPEIAEIYAEKGYITERDISLTLIKMSIPMKEIDSLLDVLNKFSLVIRENDAKPISKVSTISDKETTTTFVQPQIEPQNVSSAVSTDYIPDLLYFKSNYCHGTGRMLGKNQFLLYAGAVISDMISDSARSSVRKNRVRY